MTLSDISEFSEQAAECKSADALAQLFDDAGEDIEISMLGAVSESCKSMSDIFVCGEDSAVIYGVEAKCTKCGNTSPNTLLGSAAEILAGEKTIHLGCCECGTQFTVEK